MVFSSILLMSLAQAVPPSSASTAPVAADKVECRMQQEAHSRIPNRVCRKASEWQELSRQAEEDMKNTRGRPNIPTACQNGIC